MASSWPPRMSTAFPLTRKRGPGKEAPVDGFAHGRVRRARALRAQIAFGGKASHQVIVRGHKGRDRALRHGLLNGLQILGARMQEEVDVRIDQAGQERCVAEVDDLRSRRTLYG